MTCLVLLHNIYNERLSKIWTNEGAKTVSAILRPQITVTCNILETSCTKRTENDPQNVQTALFPCFTKSASMMRNDWDHNWYVCVSVRKRTTVTRWDGLASISISCFWIKERWSELLHPKTGLRPPPLEDVEVSLFSERFQTIRLLVLQDVKESHGPGWAQYLNMITVIKCGHFSEI